jgi:hypothetical protein
MAVAHVSSASAKDSTGTADPWSPAALSAIDGSAGNFLWVAVTWRNNASQTISGITHGGSALTQRGSTLTENGGSVAVFYRVSPGGSGQITVDWSAAPPNSQIVARVFSGVDTGAPFGTDQTSQGSATATSTSAVSGATDGMFVDAFEIRDSVAATRGGTQVNEVTQNEGGSMAIWSSTAPGATSDTLDWSWTGATSYTHHAMFIAAAAAGTTMTPAQGPLTLTGATPGLGFTINMPDEL